MFLEKKKPHRFCRLVPLGLLLGAVSLAGLYAQPPARTVTLERGTLLQLSILQGLSTRHSQEGQQFTAVVDTPVLMDGQTVLAKGTQLVGTVSRIKRPGRFRGKAELFICFDYVRLPGGREEPITASITRLESMDNKRINPEGTVQASSSVGRDTRVVLGGGGTGAGIGSVAGGGKGAAIGAAAGSLLGMVGVLLTRGQDIEIPPNSAMEVVLERPLNLSGANAAVTNDRPLHK